MSHATAGPQGDTWNGGTRPYAIPSKKFGMWLFLVSDAITFATLLFAYSYMRIVNDWPTPFNKGSIALSTAMTFCLLSSSLTMVMAVMAAHRGDRNKTFLWILGTIAGGLAFFVLHGWEWSHIIHEHITPIWGKEPFPAIWATFFCCTGMHMLHVASGVTYLFVLGIQYKAGKFKSIDIEVAGLYWHFVDLVWMFIFPLIYLLSTNMNG